MTTAFGGVLKAKSLKFKEIKKLVMWRRRLRRRTRAITPSNKIQKE